jgi:hypothetical protein
LDGRARRACLFVLFLELAGAHPVGAPEVPRQMRLVGKAAFEGYLGN